MSRKHVIMFACFCLLFAPASTLFAQGRSIEFFGNIYTKWLDGNRRVNDGLYNNSEFGNGDVGQGTEFELLFRANVSKQIEVGGRLKARFDQNFWSNGGGFADDENEPRAAQYMKFRGAYVRVTPGYDWIDSATIGSNDWGQFDPWTLGKIRYIDRDNVSGLLFQGSAADKKFRWDLARVSLPKLWAGPEFTTGELHQQDAAYAWQMNYDTGNGFDVNAIFMYIQDDEIDTFDPDNRDGVEISQRYRNTVFGGKFNWSINDYVDVRGLFYRSEFVTDYADDRYVRFTPTPVNDVEDNAYKINVDFVDIVDGLSINLEYFNIGDGYFSMMASRREQDVLLTEGSDAAWGWSRPDYNYGDNARGSSRSTIGFGGWDGTAQQVLAINADNDFTDFDEPMAESVLGWKGFTIAPTYVIGDLELSAEYTDIGYNTDFQGSGDGFFTAPDGSEIFLYPTMDGVHAWGVGGDWRSPYTLFQDRDTSIALIKANYLAPIGDGLELKFKYKVTQDEDNRVTEGANPAETAEKLARAYAVGGVDNVNYDNRDADYTTIEFSAGYQISNDLFIEGRYGFYEVDLYDGTIDVTPVDMQDWEPQFGWINYLTGDHSRDKLAFIAKYFLSGMEFGLNAQWIFGEYDPRFFRGENGNVVEFNPTEAVQTPIGLISPDTVDYKHYRLKAFLKVQF